MPFGFLALYVFIPLKEYISPVSRDFELEWRYSLFSILIQFSMYFVMMVFPQIFYKWVLLL